MRDGQLGQALEQFNQREACSSAIVLCKEPPEENRQYLQQLVEAGADMDLVDGQGYTALDYAVFAGDAVAEEIVLGGLGRGLDRAAEDKLMERRAEARLRKGYSELFQEKLRPLLLSGCADRIRILRFTYAGALAEDENKDRMFDGFKFMSYSDFCLCGKLPRSSDGLVQRCMAESLKTHTDIAANFVIFFSYRWINHAQGGTSLDDGKNTQYRRMIQATEEFLSLHAYVDRERLGIWMDYACIDQDDPMQGVSALPMIIAQCDAVTSLVVDKYYSRAWCSMEVMMVQALKRSYKLHLWYEHVLTQPDTLKEEGASSGFLREGPIDLKISMLEKDLAFEEDRSRVLFLERQSKLLS